LRGDNNVEEAVLRANAYLSAGADCAYPIFCPVAAIPELAGRIDGPINVLITPDSPPVEELAAFGVARVTWGAGLAGLAYAEAVRIAGDVLSGG
jgi:2-methylisocitrate lyase-like PEP mutase family enzyme